MVIEKIDMLLEILRGVLSEEDFYNAKELVYYGEYGVAIELICTQLYEYDKCIYIKEKNLIMDIINEMELSIDLLDGIKIISDQIFCLESHSNGNVVMWRWGSLLQRNRLQAITAYLV